MHFRIVGMITTSGFLTALECTRVVYGWGCVPDPAGGAYSAAPDPLSGLRGTVLLRDQKVARLYDIGRFTLQTDPRDMLYSELNAQCDKVSKVADSS